jgi:hypothetical protein
MVRQVIRGLSPCLIQQLYTDYAIGRIALVFALKPSIEAPAPRTMVYVQRFTAIPRTPSGVSGFYAVAKAFDRGEPRYEVISASQIARPCPLSPVFKGPATRGVPGHEVLDHYSKFYINKYRTPHEFLFLHAS